VKALNVLIPDVANQATGYGRHNRLIVYGPSAPRDKEIIVREDPIGLATPSIEECLRAIRAAGWSTRGFVLHRTETGNGCVYRTFIKSSPKTSEGNAGVCRPDDE